MTTTADDILSKTEEKMQKAIQATQNELTTVRTGRANPMMLDRITLDYYGTPTAIKQMANISVQEGTTLVIQPYDRTQLAEIERAISKSDLNLPANNDGQVIRLNIPPLSEERRKEMVKSIKKMGEEGKVAVRNIRRDATADIEKLKKAENLPEDEVKQRQDKVQKLTDRYTGQLDQMIVEKEKELLQV
ncbi:MAG: ribosome recycling factor [Vampirovibrionales bacterium]|nr:ribosome recycling factor [Vampirovibrionales bacterium]